MVVHKIFIKLKMVCFVEAKNNYASFNEIFVELENLDLERAEMLVEEICNNVSINSDFIYFYLSLY